MEAEAQRLKEIETQQKINEEKEKKRQTKIDEMKAKEDAKLEKEKELERIENARAYYKEHIMRKYILATFEHLIKIRDQKKLRADRQSQKWSKKHLLTKLNHAAQITLYEQE
jgi:hypothetical protein